MPGGSTGSSGSRRWPRHLLRRLRRLRDRMAERRLDAMLISHPPDIRYLTGFGGEDSLVLVGRRAVAVLSDRRFEQELGERHPYVRSVMRRGPMIDVLEKEVRRKGIDRLGFQPEHLSVKQRQMAARRVGARRLAAVEGWLAELRAIKDEAEVKLIGRAISVQEAAYRRALRRIEPGMTERQAAAVLEYEMRLAGADGPSFPTIVASGANGSIPHHVPGDTPVRRNTPLLIDFGAQRDGYCGDLTRVVVFGRMPRRMARVYEVVREAQLAAIERIAPGRAMVEIDAAAREVITKAGYGERFGHGLGHGLGLEVHESPGLSPRSEGQLRAGHVVTVEPGVYLPGIGGVRIEDDVLVTKTGRRKLSSLPTDLESTMI